MTNRVGEIQPFLKWAGGKRWLSGSLATYFKSLRGTYYEPFLGSGAVFFRYLPNKAYLSDSNNELIECYQAIRDYNEIVEAELISLSKYHSDSFYYNVRASQPNSAAGRAARFIYLNRTCWNGLYRVNKKGEFNVPRGTKTQIILPSDNFETISRVLKPITLRTSDFEEIISSASDGDMIFADPPYTVMHNLNGFVKYNQNIFSWSDQIRLAKALTSAAERNVIVISTNANHPEVKSLYRKNFKMKSLDRASIIAAASHHRRQTTELFITNQKLA